MAQDEPTVSQIQAAIEADGLSWEAEENFLTQMTTEERRGYLGVIVTPDEMAALEAETRAFAAQERVSFGTGVGAPAAVDWRSGGYGGSSQLRWGS